MKKSSIIISIVVVFVGLLLYCTFNLSNKLSSLQTDIRKVFDNYSEGLISSLNYENENLNSFKTSPEALHNEIYKNGVLSLAGRNWFKLISELKKRISNEGKLDSVNEKYSNTLSELTLYYLINLKSLKDFEKVSTQQIDSLIMYNTQLVGIINELRNIE